MEGKEKLPRSGRSRKYSKLINFYPGVRKKAIERKLLLYDHSYSYLTPSELATEEKDTTENTENSMERRKKRV